jgi:stage II sporulation protein AB (anti-sigma F factor)
MLGEKSWRRSLQVSFDAVAPSVPASRRAVGEVARAHGACTEDVQRIELAVSEAVTNAIVHGYGLQARGRIHVMAAVSEQELLVLVADDGCGLGAAPASSGLGLGLGVVEGSCDALTITTRAAGGTMVEMSFRLREREAAYARQGRLDQARGPVSSATCPA